MSLALRNEEVASNTSSSENENDNHDPDESSVVVLETGGTIADLALRASRAG